MDALIEILLMAVIATLLPINSLLGFGLLITWRQFQGTANSCTQNRHQWPLKYLRQISSCTTCRLALIILILIAASRVTSAEISKKSEDITKPQFQPYKVYYISGLTKIYRSHTKVQKIKSSKTLRRLGLILQYITPHRYCRYILDGLIPDGHLAHMPLNVTAPLS